MRTLCEGTLFAIIVVVVGFVVSYVSDLASSGRVVWVPPHAREMATGTFLTAITTYLLFVDAFLNYKCKQKK